ncbi:hypothetical protein LCGC14_1166000 [marine sediment metagenome]|uniref:Uncharacterized protein n=1 Tax=marine sediment metagenome TaxID=412755 RepID=A0A0F9PWR9_9ZZZZ
MKLKTLKDLEGIKTSEINGVKSKPVKTGIVSVRLLKQEAIKWVKDMDKVKIQGSINWKVIFKNFHEITEEDLK